MKQNNVHMARVMILRESHIDEVLCEQKQYQLEVMGLLRSIPFDPHATSKTALGDHTEAEYHHMRRIPKLEWDAYLTDDGEYPLI